MTGAKEKRLKAGRSRGLDGGDKVNPSFAGEAEKK